MRNALPFVLVALAGCVGAGEDGGGTIGSGGQTAPGSGGETEAGSGGSGTGGGVMGSGGMTGSGGRGTGGAASGGVVGSGGHLGSGGVVGSGGHLGSGGITASGGIVGSGGMASGGMLGRGGTGGGAGAGGRRGTGGGGGGVRGTGGAGMGGATPAKCSSGKMWTAGNGLDMRPGNDCMGCHPFPIAGTIYPTAHEPNNCDGTAAGGLKVLLTGADGSMLTLTPSAASGNFFSLSGIQTPYTAQVVDSSGAVRMMMASQTAGNCNSCHTQDGGNGAPGRIMAP